ncbi:MAG: bifunctional hydroxymethylpyrimidine kinase/phosphomethylpyrimidine kinase [Planctomycetales bacterium]|nr:bifunctional hydroxymethylpyrimidine kinase/phosphomethylpyrimidine kinase [Planctomycetales bacterium]NIM10321.1 bifunctional hydroxymethylpyrimidine kinase/phosphomethylpyrimidine kinase [Planctomycetales bacterium]NIN09768.1 bifunctional hydroxymethylpyrimidine kinase/phosphomethylpyrimidine kinase [Planctomycetales bacterium]NIN78891.1 bifunctional hydroxymethylpyrimidine kinase/phosphomethylpyrimidine kinase [Planctomycetales bacterium]NIO36062.1 bifunctional hydroxymethylpyrimidine kin
MMIPVAMTIAGSDPSGGAGLQADLKTFHQRQVYGTSIVTLLTVQNTVTVSQVRVMDPDFVVAQLDSVLSDLSPAAAKTGALGSAEVIAAVASRAVDFDFPFVIDPVMISKHGARLIDEDALVVLREQLLPCACLITPNLAEAEVLAKIEVHDLPSMEAAAGKIGAQGIANVLVKGGHLADSATDVLWCGGQIHRIQAARIDSRNTHGTGCVYSAAITAELARGAPLIDAVWQAKRFVTEAIRRSPDLGQGCGPVNLHVS